jgi:hypothetical protein
VEYGDNDYEDDCSPSSNTLNHDGSRSDVVQLPKQVYDDKCYEFIRVIKFMTPQNKDSSLIEVCDAQLLT